MKQTSLAMPKALAIPEQKAVMAWLVREAGPVTRASVG